MKKGQYILVFNCGSSSLSCKIFHCDEAANAELVFSAKAHRVGVEGKEASFLQYQIAGISAKVVVPLPDHRTAARQILEYIRSRNVPVNMIGHRFVHGGDFFKESVIIDRSVMERLQQCVPLAPIHNPVSLSVMHECRKTMPGLPAYAVFDTAFHTTIPDYAYTYPVPQSIRERFHYRKYGFHGLSYKYIARAAPALLNLPADKSKMVVCHLGTGGSSVSAIRNGASRDNSMGYSPLMGLLMSTRCGDIDPMLAIYLAVTYDMRPDDLLNMLTEKSGLLGVAGFSSDLRDIIGSVTGQEDDRAGLALCMYVHRLKKYIGSFVAVLGGIDALVFTDDIGVTNWLVREKACEAMQWCGLKLDRKANRSASLTDATLISAADSRIKVLSMPTREELIIAEEGARLIARREANDSAV
ncbi:MAG: acetate/propionate family kinase [Kiritimatiellae bacterium]|nr:acetate/propionate family kinase [Kiritimatiellia bacterium]